MPWEFLLVFLIQTAGTEAGVTTPNDHGVDIARASLKKLARLGVFGKDDNDVSIRIAGVESNFGDSEKTFREGFFGGIWQISKKMFLTTQDEATHPALTAKIEALKADAEINWRLVPWQDLVIPIRSAIAIRLLLLTNPEPIPTDIIGQSHYWRRLYNRTKSGANKRFIETTIATEVALPDCANIPALSTECVRLFMTTHPRPCGCKPIYERWNCEVEIGGVLVADEADLVGPDNQLLDGNIYNCQRDVCCLQCPPGGTKKPVKFCKDCPFMNAADHDTHCL